MKLFGGRGALIAAVALGGLTSFLVYTYVRDASQATRPVETVPVVVAATSIPARATITPDMLRIQQLPVDARHPSAYSAPKDVAGKIARAAMIEGEQVLSTRLFLQREESGLAFMIPDGMRAVSVSFSEVIGTGGLIQPGDHVDVIGVFKVKGNVPATTQPNAAIARSDEDGTYYLSTTVLEDIGVLAVAQRLEGTDDRDLGDKVRDGDSAIGSVGGFGSGSAATSTQARSAPQAQPSAKTATLAVTPEDALRLVLAEDRGKIRLALRKAQDTSAASAGRPNNALTQLSFNLTPGSN